MRGGGTEKEERGCGKDDTQMKGMRVSESRKDSKSSSSSSSTGRQAGNREPLFVYPPCQMFRSK